MAVVVTRAGKGSELTYAEVDANFNNLNTETIANTAKVSNATHTGEVTGSTALTIAANAVTLSKMAQLTTSTILGRVTAGTGNVEGLTAAQVRTVLNVADGATANATDSSLRDRATHTGTQAVGTITGLATIATSGSAADLSAGILPAARFDDTAHGARAGGTLHANVVAAGAAGFMTGADKTKLDGVATGATAYVHPNHSGDVTSVADGAQTIAAGAVTNAKLASVPTATFKGRTTAATGAPEDLTKAQALVVLNVADGATANSTDAVLLARANHTGTQAASTIGNFSASVIATVLAGFTASATRTVIVATDSILLAFGKVQKYLNDLAAIAFSGSGADLTAATVTNAKLANVATATFKGRVTAATGDPEDLTVAQAKTVLAYTPADIGAATAAQANATHTGDAAGATVLTLATVNTNVGSFGTAAQVAAFTVNGKGLTTAASAIPIAIPLSQITQSAATTNQVPQWNGTAWVPATVAAGGTVAPVTARIRRSTNQSVATGASYSDMVYDTSAYQVNGTFWTTGATVTIPETGYYQIFSEATFDGAGLVGTITANMQVLVNGAAVIGDDEKQVIVGATAALYVMAQRNFTIGDTIKVQVKHTNATAVNILAQGDHSPDIIVTKLTGAKGDPGAGLTDGDKGDITVSGVGTAWTVDPAAITLAKQADVATGTVFYRKTALAGAPEVQTLATLKTDLGLSNTNTGDQTITLTGAVTGTGTGSFATTIPAASITLAQLADIPTATVVGRVAAGTGIRAALTATELTTLINPFTSLLKGAVPASGGGTTTFLRADGTFAAPAGGGSPGGTTGQMQFNNAGAFGGAANVEIASGNVKLVSTTDPAAPTGGVILYSRVLANRHLPTFEGPDSRSMPLQPMMMSSATGLWLPPGNTTAGPGVTGFLAPAVTGFTATGRTILTTNYFNRRKRLGLVTAATAAAVGQFKATQSQYTIGSGAGVGGFYFAIRFGCSDAATVAGARMFMGMGPAGTTPSNIEPNTLVNSIGIGHGAADTNMKLFYGGSTAQTPIDLGVNFPANTLSVDVYELILFAPPNTVTVHYQVKRLNTTDVASGTLSGTAGVALPAGTTLINLWGYRTNNATALACGLDVMAIQLEPGDE